MKSPSQDVGPGTYDGSTIEFGKNIKSFTIGTKAPNERPSGSPGPGAYKEGMESAEKLTKSRIPGAGILPVNKSVDQTQASSNQNLGPGAYEGNNEFGRNAQGFTIGERRSEKSFTTAGPG
jgi:hypothetical protein